MCIHWIYSYPLLLDFQPPIIRLIFPKHILKDHAIKSPLNLLESNTLRLVTNHIIIVIVNFFSLNPLACHILLKLWIPELDKVLQQQLLQCHYKDNTTSPILFNASLFT